MIALLSRLKNSSDPEYPLLQSKIRERILAHDLTVTSTDAFLQTLLKDPSLAAFSQKLLDQMMNYPDLPLLWHCYYARIFDSLIVRHLVDNPPKKVRESVYKMGLPLAELLERELYVFQN